MDDLLLQSTPSTWLTNTSTTTPAANSTQCVEMDTSAMNLMYAIFMVLLLLCSVFGNTVVILAVFLSNKLTDRSTFYFIASLGKTILFILNPNNNHNNKHLLQKWLKNGRKEIIKGKKNTYFSNDGTNLFTGYINKKVTYGFWLHLVTYRPFVNVYFLVMYLFNDFCSGVTKFGYSIFLCVR